MNKIGTRAWLCMVAVALGLSGCTDGPPRLTMPPKGKVAEAFPTLEEVPEKAAPKALEVTLTEPTGTIHALKAINVGFNMPIEQPEGTAALLKIEPPIEGQFRWLGNKTVSFLPSGKLPLATKFKVTVPSGVRAKDGQVLESARTFEFSTPGLRVARFDPSWYNARLRPDDVLFVQFNLPVDKAQLKNAISMTRLRQPVPFTLTATDKDRGGDKVPAGTGFFIKPKNGFTPGSGFNVVIDAGLKPEEGSLGLSASWQRTLSPYGPFAVLGARCGWGNCTPDSSWSVEFSNPVTAAKIAKCVKIAPRADLGVPYGYANSRHVTFRPKKLKPGQLYKLSFSGCVDDMGNTLGKTHTTNVAVGHYPPRITMSRGINFIESGGQVKFPVTLLNTPDLHLRMARITEDKLAGFLTSFNRWSGDDSLKTVKPQVDRPFNVKVQRNVKKTYGINLGEVLGTAAAGVVYLDVQSGAYDKHRGYSGTQRHKTLLQVTDIGLTAKYSPESVLVWATSLSTTDPKPGVRIAMRTADNTLLWEGTTDKDGMAKAPGLKTFGGKKPRIITASSGEELSFLDLNDWSMQIEPYRFDLPYDWDAPAVALRGMIFTERGVYRPGEKAHVKGYMRMDKGRTLELLPTDRAQITVKDAQDNIVATEEISMTDLDGFDFEIPIPEQAPLGTWRIEAMPVGLDGGAEGRINGNFRVEAYRAPDFEVVLTPAKKDVLVGDKAPVTISGQYLFGAPMGGATVNWSARRVEGKFSPVKFEQFAFGDQAGRFWWYREDRAEVSSGSGGTKLDGAGMINETLDVMAHEDLKGPQVLQIEASVQDLNRQVVSGQTSVRVHPGDYYIGLRRPGYLVEAGKRMSVDVVAVGVEGNAKPGQDVEVALQKRVWTSVRKTMAGGGTTWVSESKDTTLTTCKVRTAATSRPCGFDLQKPGYYVLRASGKDGKGRQIETTTSFYAWGGGWSWWGNSDDERIDLIPDKATYKIGEKARLMVKSPFREARALVTVERRGILEQHTIELKGSASTIEVPVTEAMLPNAFVSVVLIRGRTKAPKNDDGTTVDPGKPAFKIGYASIAVDRSEKFLTVDIEPQRKVYQPGEEVVASISVKDSKGQPAAGELTFMAVDEGVLSLTAYKTPDPVAVFFKKQSLAVITAESRTSVIAKVDADDEESGDKGDEGGGGGAGGESTNYRSAFATTAAFMPTVQVGADGRATVSFTLPDNLTAFRLMAVSAASGNRFGSSQTRIQVQKPLMLRPSLPRFASTTDTFDVRAVIQAVGDHHGKVRVDVESTGPVELTGPRSTEITLAKGQAREVSFPAVVGAPGDATFRFVATGVEGFEVKDAVKMTLPVRFPAVTRKRVETGALQAKTTGATRTWKKLNLPEDIRSDVGGLTVELASSAMADLMPGLNYLVGYPYGCIEQTTGRTLPLVAMRELVGDVPLPGIKSEDINKFAQSGIDRLFSMQTYEGGLGYWPGDDIPHPWGSAYGGLALVIASQSKTIKVDENKLDRLLDYLRDMLRDDVRQDDWWSAGAMDNTKAFAAYVLAEAGEAEPSYNTRLFNSRRSLSNFGKGLLAMAVMRSGGDGAMVDTLLEEMLAGAHVDAAEAHLNKEDRSHYWEIMDSDVRSDSIALMAMMMARYKPALASKFSRGLLNARRGGRWISTQENAFAILSLMDFFHTTEKDTPNFTAIVGLGDDVVMEETFKKRAFKPRRFHIPMKDLLTHQGDVLSLVREGNTGPLYYTMTLAYAPANPPTEAYDNGFTLRREYLAAEGPNKGQAIEKIAPGQVVKVRLTLVAPQTRHYVAIDDPLPAGLEPINTNFATTAPSLAAEANGANNNYDDWDWWYGHHSFDRIEQLDDRIVLFADHLPEGIYTHTYLARATTPGDYTVPAARVEEMYVPSTYGRTEAFKFQIR